VQRYWSIGYASQRKRSEAAYLDEVDLQLKEAVKACMIADVPIGVFLSGGIDSSLVTSYLAELSDRPVKTFSVGFGKHINELPYAKMVADRYKTDHTVLQVDPDIEGVIGDIAWYYRRLGYILCEQGDYTLAKHCQLYSLIFEDSDMAYNELEFLDSVSGSERFDYRQMGEAFDRLMEEAVGDLDGRGMLFRFGEDQVAVLMWLSENYAGADPELYERALAFYEALDGEVRIM
jgi:hypothetical protein